MNPEILTQLAPTGKLRVGLNMANNLLNTGPTVKGEPDGVAPDMGRSRIGKIRDTGRNCRYR